ncbi:MAG: hypothetical protein Q8S84_09350 [bacterium]|nr:hypothetical protein [bacterium]
MSKTYSEEIFTSHDGTYFLLLKLLFDVTNFLIESSLIGSKTVSTSHK